MHGLQSICERPHLHQERVRGRRHGARPVQKDRVRRHVEHKLTQSARLRLLPVHRSVQLPPGHGGGSTGSCSSSRQCICKSTSPRGPTSPYLYSRRPPRRFHLDAMKPPHSKLLRKCVAAEKAPRGSAAGQVNGKGKSSAHRGPVVRKRTPMRWKMQIDR